MRNTPQRGSRTSSPTKHDSSPAADALVIDERRPSPAKPPSSPLEEGQVVRTPSREHGKHFNLLPFVSLSTDCAVRP